MEGGRGAVLVGSSACPGTAVQAFLTASSLHLSQVELACASTAPTSHSPRELDAVLLACAPGQLSTARDSLKYASRLLKPSAQLFLAFGDNTLEEAKKELLLAGFLNAELVDGAGLVKAVKPTWELGAKAALSIKRPAPAALAAQPATMPAAAPTASKAWVLTAQDDDELLDEDSLLTEEDKLRPAAAPAGTDCSTSKKACKNCSCGRADAEAAGEAVVLTQAMLDNPQTNCGSCALGDAFRCAGCPYRGLPMFEPGKKITLTSDFLTADA